jgi:hypothetical protein
MRVLYSSQPAVACLVLPGLVSAETSDPVKCGYWPVFMRVHARVRRRS